MGLARQDTVTETGPVDQPREEKDVADMNMQKNDENEQKKNIARQKRPVSAEKLAATELYNKLRNAFIQPLPLGCAVTHEVSRRDLFVRDAIEKKSPEPEVELFDMNALLNNLSLMLIKLKKRYSPNDELDGYLEVACRELDIKEKDLREKYAKCQDSPYSLQTLRPEIIHATQLAFCLAFQVKVLTSTDPNALERTVSNEVSFAKLSFASMNKELGEEVAQKLSHFSGYRLLAGIAIAIFGLALGVTAGLAVATACGATFGGAGVVLAPIFLMTPQWSIVSVSASLCYLVSEITHPQNPIPKIDSCGKFAAVVVGMITTVPTGFAALARGIHTIWTSGAKHDPLRVSTNKILALKQQDVVPPARKPSM